MKKSYVREIIVLDDDDTWSGASGTSYVYGNCVYDLGKLLASLNQNDLDVAYVGPVEDNFGNLFEDH